MKKLKYIFPVVIATLLVSGIVYAVQTGGAGHNNIEVDSGGRTVMGYDATVCSIGCNYTSIVTALATEGINKSIYVGRGTYTESADIIFASGQMVNFDGEVIVNFSGNQALYTASDCVLTGKLKLNGEGKLDGGVYVLLNSADSVNYWDSSQCRIELNITDRTADTDPQYGAFVLGDNNKLWLYTKDVTITGATGSTFFYSGGGAAYNEYKVEIINYSVDIAAAVNIVVLDGSVALNNHINLIIDKATNAQAYDVKGLLINNDNNTARVNIDEVNTTSGGGGIGVNVSGDYNCIYGVSRNCDSSNANIGGIGNKTGELAI